MRYYAVLALCFLPLLASQANADSLKTFEAGKRVKASEVNGNFNYLDQKINASTSDEPPKIEVLNFGYDSALARYTGDLIISDDSELLRVKVPTGELRAPVAFYQALTVRDLVVFFTESNLEYSKDFTDARAAIQKIKEFWPAPLTNGIAIENASFAQNNNTLAGSVQIFVQDSAGKVSRLIVDVPAWPGNSFFVMGKYVLDAAPAMDFTGVEDACPAPETGFFSSIESLTLSEYAGGSTPINYFLTNPANVALQYPGNGDDLALVFTSNQYNGTNFSRSRVTVKYISDTVVTVEPYFECGECPNTDLCYNYGDGDGILDKHENLVPAFKLSPGETTAVLNSVN